jgi:hypothetical protein
MLVVVADDQLSLAIGKGGQNARLAARLTGWKIDLVSKTDQKRREELERSARVEVEKLELGEATTEKLISAGIETVQELMATPLERLVEIPGIGEKTAEKLLAAGQEYLAAHPVAPPAGDLAFTPEMETAAATGSEPMPEAPETAVAPNDGDSSADNGSPADGGGLDDGAPADAHAAAEETDGGSR